MWGCSTARGIHKHPRDYTNGRQGKPYRHWNPSGGYNERRKNLYGTGTTQNAQTATRLQGTAAKHGASTIENATESGQIRVNRIARFSTKAYRFAFMVFCSITPRKTGKRSAALRNQDDQKGRTRNQKPTKPNNPPPRAASSWSPTTQQCNLSFFRRRRRVSPSARGHSGAISVLDTAASANLHRRRNEHRHYRQHQARPHLPEHGGLAPHPSHPREHKPVHDGNQQQNGERVEP